MTAQNNNDMGYRFEIIKRVFENDAIIAFIDLLGTRKLYENTLAEEAADKRLEALLTSFDIKFSECFGKSEGGLFPSRVRTKNYISSKTRMDSQQQYQYYRMKHSLA